MSFYYYDPSCIARPISMEKIKRWRKTSEKAKKIWKESSKKDKAEIALMYVAFYGILWLAVLSPLIFVVALGMGM